MATESIVKQALKCCLFFPLLSLCFTRFSLFSFTKKKVVERGHFTFAIYLFVFSFVLSLTLVLSLQLIVVLFSLMQLFVRCAVLMFSMYGL